MIKKNSESVWPLVIVLLPIFVSLINYTWQSSSYFKGGILYVAYSIHELVRWISVDWNFVTHDTKKIRTWHQNELTYIFMPADVKKSVINKKEKKNQLHK